MDGGLISSKPRVSFCKSVMVDRYLGWLTWIRLILGRRIAIGRPEQVGAERAAAHNAGERRRAAAGHRSCRFGSPRLGYGRGLAGKQERGVANAMTGLACAAEAADNECGGAAARRSSGVLNPVKEIEREGENGRRASLPQGETPEQLEVHAEVVERRRSGELRELEQGGG